MYAPSPFAKYYEYQGPGYSMKTIINVFGERVVLFTDQAAVTRPFEMTFSFTGNPRSPLMRPYNPTKDRLGVTADAQITVATDATVQLSSQYFNLEDL